jgi:4-diphosphocytidyl-2-C-methyl-D-erythritol kinase
MLASGSIEAPAKINLTLEILDRLDDGYHRLRSVMIPVGIYDRIEWMPSESFSFVTDDPALAAGNLVERAAEAIGLQHAPVALALRKQIPVGGGLGGGSSDAAAVLRAAMRGAFGEAGRRDWVATARALGSDVPFFLIEGPALVEGTGERLTALGAPPPWWVCVAMPPAAVNTGDAYRKLDEGRKAVSRRARAQSPSVAIGEALQRADFAAVQGLLYNDFELVIPEAYPPIARALDALAAAGAARPTLSGSGACVFALCETESAARKIAEGMDGVARALAVPFAVSAVWTAAR